MNVCKCLEQLCSLDLEKLKELRPNGDGSYQAACPACLEKGSDKSHDHLRIFPDGKFGCAVYSGAKTHRRRVFQLAGKRSKVRKAATLIPGPIIEVSSWRSRFSQPH